MINYMSKKTEYCRKVSGYIDTPNGKFEYHPYGASMKRLYVKTMIEKKRKLITIGWICPICHDIKLEKVLKNLKGKYTST